MWIHLFSGVKCAFTSWKYYTKIRQWCFWKCCFLRKSSTFNWWNFLFFRNNDSSFFHFLRHLRNLKDIDCFRCSKCRNQEEYIKTKFPVFQHKRVNNRMHMHQMKHWHFIAPVNETKIRGLWFKIKGPLKRHSIFYCWSLYFFRESNGYFRDWFLRYFRLFKDI